MDDYNRYLNTAMSAAELVWKRGLALEKGIGTLKFALLLSPSDVTRSTFFF